jgi:TonB-dependent siderophore receptor
MRYWIFSLVCAAAVPSWAQTPAPTPSPSPEPPRYKEEVEVEEQLPAVPVTSLGALKMPLPVTSTPASLSVVPRTLFESQQALVLSDALLNAGGVHVSSNFGVHDYFVVRGFDSLSGGLVLTDGAPEPEATFYPLYNVRQVEVLKGPSAFLYGGNPLAASVQLIRKQPQSGRFGDVSLTLGRFGTREAAVDLNGARPDGTLSARLNAVGRDSDSYRDGRDSRVFAVNPAVTWRPDPRTRVSLNAEFVRSEYNPDSGIPLTEDGLAEVPRTRSYQSPLDASEQDIWRVRLDAERTLGRVVLRDKVYLTDLDWRSDGTLINGLFPSLGGPVVARTMLLLDDRQRFFGNQAEALVSARTGGLEHHLLLGLELARQTDDFTLDIGLLPVMLLNAPVDSQPPTLIPPLSSRGDSRATVIAPYVMDRVTRGRVEVLLGARLDRLDYADAATGTERETTELSPLGGIVLSAGRGLSLYASAGKAFAPPSTQVVGEREPERSRQVEVGAKKQFLEGKALATVAVYHLERDNIAIPDATGALRQAGDQRSRGLEVELAAEPGDGWYATAAYAWNDPELTSFSQLVIDPFGPPALFDRSGNDPAFAPHHIASAWVMKQLGGGLGLAAGARYVGEQFVSEDNTFAIDSYLTLDAAVSYRRGRVKGSVNFKNLTGTEYEQRGFGGFSVIPANPFAVYARVELALGSR